MIDWISARVPLDWQTPINGGRFVSIGEDGSVEYQTDKRKAVVGSFQSHIAVRSVEVGFVEVSGNPAKFLQGHNLFGSDDVGGLFLAMMYRIVAALGVEPSSDDVDAWVRGQVALSRVDLTTSYELPSRHDVREWLEAASAVASVKWRGRGHYKPGTLTFGMVGHGKRAKQWQLTLYCKGDEIAVPGHTLHPDLPDVDRLFDWADNKLRVELRLRTSELKRLKLATLHDWAERAPMRVLEAYLGKVDIGAEQMVHVDIDEDPRLKPRHRMVLALWRTGVDVKGHMARRTFYRVRRELIDLTGCDVASLVAVSNVVPLRRALEAVPAPVPAWAASAMFVPSARVRIAA